MVSTLNLLKIKVMVLVKSENGLNRKKRLLMEKVRENPKITDKDFNRLGRFIEDKFGIRMPASKKLMLQARLQKRLRELGYNDFQEYVRYIFSNRGRDEILKMIDEVTTNKTGFFREADQFEFLQTVVLPELMKLKPRGRIVISIWSAGCSTGEEPYSIAIVMAEFANKHSGIDFEILATDLSRKVLQEAKLAIYKKKSIEPIPIWLRKKYLLKSKTGDEIYRLVPEIRAKVKFRRHNLMTADNFMDKSFDIIFCRNVMIYFEQAKQKQLLMRFYQHLYPGGYLFLGHSETIVNFNLPFRRVKPKVYLKPFQSDQ